MCPAGRPSTEPIDPTLRAEGRRRLIDGLLELRAQRALTGAAVAGAATKARCSERTIWRWLAAGLPDDGSERCERSLDDDLRESYARCGGNVAEVWRQQQRLGRIVPSLRALQRLFAQEMTAAQRASVRSGEAGRRAHSLYLRYEATHRNEVWQTDHKQLPVLVRPPRGQPARPWVTLFEDDYSRAIMGWAISMRPSSAEVLAALRDALLVDPARGPFGGVPRRVRRDNGLDFAASAVQEAALALGIENDAVIRYEPTAKGKVERLNGTIDGTFVALLPAYANRPRDARGRCENNETPLGLATFVRRFDAWVRDYNQQRTHSELGCTPLERWSADPTPIVEIEPETARLLLLARKTARVQRDGIHHQRLIYASAAIAGLVGEDVQIAAPPHDRRSIEVFHRGTWVGRAFPQNTLTEEQRTEVLKARRHEASVLRDQARTARRKAHPRLAPATADAPAPPDVVELPREDEAVVALSDAALRRAASTDLLVNSDDVLRARR